MEHTCNYKDRNVDILRKKTLGVICFSLLLYLGGCRPNIDVEKEPTSISETVDTNIVIPPDIKHKIYDREEVGISSLEEARDILRWIAAYTDTQGEVAFIIYEKENKQLFIKCIGMGPNREGVSIPSDEVARILENNSKIISFIHTHPLLNLATVGNRDLREELAGNPYNVYLGDFYNSKVELPAWMYDFYKDYFPSFFSYDDLVKMIPRLAGLGVFTFEIVSFQGKWILTIVDKDLFEKRDKRKYEYDIARLRQKISYWTKKTFRGLRQRLGNENEHGTISFIGNKYLPQLEEELFELKKYGIEYKCISFK